MIAVVKRGRSRRERCLADLATWQAVAPNGADENERALVLEARRLGLSWGLIAESMGLARQSVWERYGADDVAADHAKADTTDSGFAYIHPPVGWSIRYALHSDPSKRAGIDAERLGYVMRQLAKVREANDTRLRAAVEACLNAGASWDDIGWALGISKQAAHHRFRSSSPTP